MSIEGAADREYAFEVGRERRDSAWILSDRDVWYRNPFYRGPPQPHPDDERDESFELE
jgi:hypothetical protein